MKHILFVILLFAGTCICRASADDDWEEVYQQYVDIMGDDAETNENIYDILYELYLNPIDINKAGREDLEQLPFLSDAQIEAICAYLYFYDGMESLGELALIEKLDYYTRRLLTEFIYIGENDGRKFPSLRNIIKYGKHDVMVTAKIPFYEREGDREGYMGYKYRHSLRYNFKYGNYLRAGFVGSQDAGEPFFKGDNRAGYDFYSYFLLLRDLGRIKYLALGRYRTSFGMGIVMNNNFSLGKTANTSLAGKVSNSITAHSSSYDGTSLQGAAATVNVLKNVDVSAFVSYKALDATLNEDGSIRSLSSSGYHRTEKEMEKKNNTRQFVGGGSVLWRAGGFHAGLTGYYAWFNRPFAENDDDSYRLYGPVGYSFFNIGVNYGFINHRFEISGETATNKKGAAATINCITYNINDRLSVKAIQRFYSYRYYSLFANGFSDGGHIQNESGIYLGADYKVNPYLNVSAYADYAYFPFKRYNTSGSSHSLDNMINILYSRNSFTLGVRHRYRDREKNLPNKGPQVHCYDNATRIDGGYARCRNSLKLQWNGHVNQHKDRSFGWMGTCYGSLGIGEKFTLHALAGYFRTDDYSSRIYIYEHGPMYSFNFPAFYGKGMRFSFSSRYDFGKKLMVIMRYGITKYFDRDEISSGLRRVEASYLSDLDIQLRIKI